MADDSSFRKVLIAGYPKSGNTWLGYMISFLLGAQYVDLHQSKSKPTLVKTILELIGGHLPHSTHYKIVAKTHSLPQDVPDIESYDKIIPINS